jgi:hypothetical protein
MVTDPSVFIPMLRDAHVPAEVLEPLPMKGVAHDHFRLPGLGLVLRVPRLSQMALPPEENLAYQAACFERAQRSRHTPGLATVLAPRPDLPHGALVVEDIVGRPPMLPDDMDRIALALAALHSLPVPTAAQRPPLADQHDPFGATLAVIERHAQHLAAAALPDRSQRILTAELDDAHAAAAGWKMQPAPITLVGTDTHPGNFLITGDGRAVLVDLEKAVYGAPAIDLAHASLETSTTWDRDVDTVLSPAAVDAFYRTYQQAIRPELGAAVRPWLAPARRLTWLRTVMWCVRWRVLSASNPDWSAGRVAPDLLAHIGRRVAGFFEPDTLERLRAQLPGFALDAPG